MAPEGPLALPGTYRVRLAVGGRTLERPLEVAMDPRVDVPAGALEDQLELALAIRDAVSERVGIAEAASELSKRLAALEERKGLSSGLRGDIRGLRSRIDSVAASLPDGLSSLEEAVQSADREPPAQTRAAWARLSAELGAATRRWEALRRTGAADLDARLRKAGLPAISAPTEPSPRAQEEPRP